MGLCRGLERGWLGLGLMFCLTASAAAGPWDKILTLNRVEADPKKAYLITEKNGPWMIMACSFSCDPTEEQARQKALKQAAELVLELRKRYKLPSFLYDKKFEFGKQVAGRGVDRFGNPVKMKYKRGAETEEIAVLVGDYPRADDSEAQETLKKLKYYHPNCLSLEKTQSTSRTLAGWRMLQAAVLPEGNEKKKRGPMSSAFITTNPLLPSDFFTQRGVDELVLKANEGVDHCLLECPGKFSVQVAHFTGRWIIDQKEIAAIQHGKAMDSKLEEATWKAHEMAETLRKAGIEAWEFHDHSASIVTVGSFNSVGRQDDNGVLHLDPEVQAVIARFQGGNRVDAISGSPIMAPKTLKDIVPKAKTEENIPFDVQPIVVQVPKRSVSALLNRQHADLKF